MSWLWEAIKQNWLSWLWHGLVTALFAGAGELTERIMLGVGSTITVPHLLTVGGALFGTGFYFGREFYTWEQAKSLSLNGWVDAIGDVSGPMLVLVAAVLWMI